ncbi:hypothetical protein GGR56DRAFT_508939 [Xylariaceae sp. FL0804]|nr:hypothetical protein GGR56DRAFT_508939 [Xylariaceae sp. FL0804]
MSRTLIFFFFFSFFSLSIKLHPASPQPHKSLSRWPKVQVHPTASTKSPSTSPPPPRLAGSPLVTGQSFPLFSLFSFLFRSVPQLGPPADIPPLLPTLVPLDLSPVPWEHDTVPAVPPDLPRPARIDSIPAGNVAPLSQPLLPLSPLRPPPASPRLPCCPPL